jgi:hypothetical protein
MEKTKTIFLWILGITLFLTIFFFDAKRVHKEEQTQKIYWQIRRTIREEVSKEINEARENENELLRTQVNQLSFVLEDVPQNPYKLANPAQD